MNTSYKGKELVRAGHAFAAAIAAETPFIEIAKMVSNLASTLDVQIVRAQQLTLENAALKAPSADYSAIVRQFELVKAGEVRL